MALIYEEALLNAEAARHGRDFPVAKLPVHVPL
jgi:hypothetical protein